MTEWRRAPKALKCSVADCARQVFARAFCSAHYQRWRNHGDPNHGGPYRAKAVACVVDGCEREYYSRGFCSAHDRRWKRHGDPLLGGRFRARSGAPIGSGSITQVAIEF